MNQRGIAHILPILLIVGLILAVVGYLFYTGSLTSNKKNIELTEEYENPFEKETQYINPFDEYKNPFDNVNE